MANRLKSEDEEVVKEKTMQGKDVLAGTDTHNTGYAQHKYAG